MKRLVTFGDSFTAGYGVSDSEKWRGHGRPDKFEDFYRRMNSWPRFLAEKLDTTFVNMGMCDNFGNRDIYNLIKENKIELLSDDLIIIAFSFPYRNETSPIEDYKKISELLKDHNVIYFNAFFPIFEEELNYEFLDLTNFLNYKESFIEHLIECEKNTNKPHFEKNEFWKAESKRGGWLHPNLLGYKEIANYIFDKLKQHNVI